ncbi:efflux RND transporter periplasmic adaptor subunit [uncultured Muriicola sp.]|uniref:efflux RND transporter periplasmic adaptor subunit n=1 Tax=uncultured Muriicola sp. TaxID=1583102 RepID=UPI002613CF90|nr:efflux RND transporter periplasmic adaptor subunit [uncultured Muriicola sp.]
MKHNNYIIGLLALTFLAIGCGSEDKKKVADNSPAVQVRVSSVYEDSNNPFLTVSGKVEAAKSANISTRMMGYVDKIYVQVGDKVRNGQLLLSVNNVDVSAKLAQVNAGITEAEAAFNNAEKDYNRYTALFQDNSASRKELDDMTAQFKMSKARLEAARQMKNEVNAQLSYANIRAPFSGVVTNKFINTGDMANPGMPLLEVESPGAYQILAMVPESEILAIQKDTEVDVQLKSLGKLISGKITEVSTSAKNTGGQYMVKVLLDASDANILSGMYATVQFPMVEDSSKAIMIPKDAIVHKGQLTGIYTISQNNTAMLRWLRLGRAIGDKVEVLSGLSTDEEYIVSAEGKLYNGVKISIQ